MSRPEPLEATTRRREFVCLGAAALTCPLSAKAQKRSGIPRIGILWHAGSAEEEAVFLKAIRQGLSDFGYVEGKNIILENRFPAEIPERFISFATELADLNVDVLV